MKFSPAKQWLENSGPLAGLIVIYLLFAMLAPESFTSLRNLELIARQTAIVGICSLGMTFVIISGGIDLSVGSVIALVTIVVAWLLRQGCDPFTAAAGGLLTGLGCGLANGVLITKLRVVPFIVTLGTLLIFRGLAKGVANEQKIDAPLSWLNEMLAVLEPEYYWLIVPAGVWLLLLLTVLAFLLLKYTRFGLHATAIGSNENAARLCGIAIERVKIAVYALCGICAGIGGLLQFSRLTVGDPTVASGLELDVIAAVVIGGGSLSGGEGSIAGTIIGALIMTVIRSGCTQIGVSNWLQEIITGFIIIISVTMDSLRHRRRKAGG
ncbi:MAG TPA: ABC transporter permease [Candidatus Obscuribacterales bacterium]